MSDISPKHSEGSPNFNHSICMSDSVLQKSLKWVAVFQKNEGQIRKMCDNEWLSDKPIAQAKNE